MAEEEIGTLVARVVADTEQFRSEMLKLSRQVETNTARTNRALSSIGKATSALGASFRMVTRVAGLFGVALSARALINFTTQTINAAAELHNLSKRLNISVESLSELQYVAKLTDVDFGSMTASLQFMTRVFGQAARGGKEAQEMFRNLGLDFRLLAELPVDVQLEAVAEALSRVENESQRTAFQQQVLGRGGVAMAQAMEGGAAKIRVMRQELRDLQGVTTTELAAAANESQEALTRLTAAITPLKNALINELVPSLTTVATKMREAFFPTDTEAIITGTKGAIAKLREQERALQAQLRVQEGARKNPLGRLFGIDYEARIKDLQQKLDATRASIAAMEAGLARLSGKGGAGAGAGGAGGAGAGGAPTNVPGVITPIFTAKPKDLSAANEMFAQAQRWADKTRELLVKQETARANAMKMAQAEAELLQQSAELRLETEGQLSEQLTEILIGRMQERLAIEDELTRATEDHERIRLQAKKDAADQGVEVARAAAAAELGVRQQVTSAAVGLLSAIGSEHRGAAIAALAITKAIAIKEILINAKRAAMLAYASQLIPGDPSSLVRAQAAYARTMAMGKVSAALVAATGLIEAAQLSHGGTQATRGTTANPLITSSVGAAASGGAAAAGRKQSVVTVQFMGPIYGWDDYIRNKVIDSIREAVDGKDVVIIGPTSLQAQLIGGG